MADIKKIIKDDLLSITHYVKVSSISTSPPSLRVEDIDSGLNFSVIGESIISRMSSASEFNNIEKLTKTALAQKLITAYGKPFTVCFTKQDGSERVLRGRLIEPEPLLGRSKVEDLDIDASEHRMRLVDHRELKWLIIDGVKYEVKK